MEQRDILLKIRALGFENIEGVEAALKGANKELKQATNVEQYREAQKAVATYSNAIGDYKKETRDVSAAQNVQKGSLIDLRNQLKELTSTRNGLPATGKEFQELQKKIKSTSDEIKGIEQTGGDFRRSVGNYAEGTKVFGVSLGDVKTQLTALKAGLGSTGTAAAGTSTGFNVMKLAIIGTGIGALVIILGSVITFLKSTDEGTNKLAGAMKGMGFIIGKITDIFSSLGAAILNPKQALVDLSFLIKDQIENRINGLIGIIKALGMAMAGDFKGALKQGTESLLKITTGVENSTGKLMKFTNELNNAAKAGMTLSQQLDKLEDDERNFSVQIAINEAAIERLTIKSKDRTKADKDRLEMLNNASKLETENLNLLVDLATQKLDIAKLENSQIQKNSKEKDDAMKKEADAFIELLKIKGESESLQEKLTIKKNILLQEIEDDNAKRKEAKTKEADLQVLQSEKKRIQAFIDANEKLNKSIEENTKKEREAQELKTEFTKEELDKQFDLNQRFEKDKAVLKENFALQTAEIQKQIKTEEAKFEQEVTSQTLSVLKDLFEENKELYKTFSVLEILVNLQKEISAIQVAAAANPLNAVTGGAAGTAQATILGGLAIARAAISTKKILAYAGGGTVPFGNELPQFPRNGDNTLILVKPGEVVLNAGQQEAIGGPAALGRAKVPGFANSNLTSQATQAFRSRVTFAKENSRDAGKYMGESMPPPVVSIVEITKAQNRVNIKDQSFNL